MTSPPNSKTSEKIQNQKQEQSEGGSSERESDLGKTLIYGIGFLFFLVISFMAWYTLGQIEAQTREDIASSLKSRLRTTRASLHIWEFERKADVATWAESTELKAEVEELLKVPRNRKALMKAPGQAKLASLLQPKMQGYGYLGYFIIAPDFINIASMHDSNLGVTNLLAKQGDFIERIFDGDTLISHPLISDVPLENVAGKIVQGEPTMFVATPIFDNEGVVMAVLDFRIDPAMDFTRILQLTRVGKTGETYAFNSSGKLLSESRFDRDLRNAGLIPPGKRGILSLDIRDPGGNLREGFQPELPREKQPFTAMAEIAISGRGGVDTSGYRNYRGIKVVGAWSWDSGFDFGLATEIEAEEAYRSFNTIRKLTLFAIGFTGLFAIALTFIVNIGRTRALSLVAAVDVGRTRALHFAKIAQEREARIRGVVDNVGDAIITIGEKGVIESFSSAAEKIFGYFAPEIVGRNISLLMPEPHKSEHNTYLKNYLETGNTKIIGRGREVEGLKKDGSVFPLDIAVSELWLEDRRLFIGTLRDITQRKQAEDEVRQSHLELQTAHLELKQSMEKVQNAHKSLVATEKLAGIAGLTAGVCEEVIDTLHAISTRIRGLVKKGEIKAWAETQKEIGRIEKIIQSLLKFYRKEEVEIVKVRIHEELDSILILGEHQMVSENIKVVKSFNTELPELIIDPDEIRQVFLYIIDNARDAMPDGGTLTTSTMGEKKEG
ncbi:MAG: PAS domain S-box protein, partial [Nitrospinales bacterium]